MLRQALPVLNAYTLSPQSAFHVGTCNIIQPTESLAQRAESTHYGVFSFEKLIPCNRVTGEAKDVSYHGQHVLAPRSEERHRTLLADASAGAQIRIARSGKLLPSMPLYEPIHEVNLHPKTINNDTQTTTQKSRLPKGYPKVCRIPLLNGKPLSDTLYHAVNFLTKASRISLLYRKLLDF